MFTLLVLACTGGEVPDTSSPGSTGEEDSGTHRGTASLVQHGQVLCEDSTLRESEGPLVQLDHGEDWESQLTGGLTADTIFWGTGLVIEDFDADGYWDVLLVHDSLPMLFRGGATPELSLVKQSVPKPTELEGVKYWQLLGAAAGDLDGDGTPDLLLSTRAASIQAYTNDGSDFHLATEASLLPDTFLFAETLPLGDLDGDGDLDLFVGQDSFESAPPDPSNLDGLFLNQGDGSFEDISGQVPEEWRDGYTKVAVIADLDDDGDQDIYVIHHQALYRTNHLLLSTEEGFQDSPEAGLNIKLAGMGVGLGDVNDDGLLDLLMSGWGELALMESLSPGNWHRTEKTRELMPSRRNDQMASWACELVDMDNDGDLDAMCGFGPARYEKEGLENPEEQPDGLWLREGDVFVEVAAEWGMDQEVSTRSLAVYDHNGDGWLDVIKCGEGVKAAMWTARCGEAAWVTVLLDQPVPNPRGIGAKVQATAGERTWTRWLTGASTSFRSSPPPQLHFGLGDVDVLDSLVVTWPDGTRDTFTDVSTRQNLTVLRTQEHRED